MNSDHGQEDKQIIALSDVWRLVQKFKTTIIRSMLIVAALGALYGLTRPVEYRVEATFREKSPKPANINTSLVAMIISGSGTTMDNEAIATLKSRKLLTPVIEKLNLQATVSRKQDSDSYLGRIYENIKIELAHFRNSLYPSLTDSSCPLKAESIVYTDETPFFLKVFFPDNTGRYQLLNTHDQLLGEGKLGTPFSSGQFQFTLTCSTTASHKNETYSIALWPLEYQAAQISKKMQIEMDKGDKNLLKISYQNRDRHLATAIVNQSMAAYQDYLKQSHDREADLQVGYLTKRQEETGDHLAQLMEKHADSLSEDVSRTGFTDSQKEMEFLAQNQHEFKERLINNELEIKRLQNVQAGKCVYYDQYRKEEVTDHNIINGVLEKIRDLKQQRDALTLALNKSDFLNTNDLQTAFVNQQVELDDLQRHSQELKEMIQHVQNGTEPDTSTPFFNDRRFLFSTWYNDLRSGVHPNEKKEQFLTYLNNLQRLFNVNEKIIAERLIHQQNPSLEYQGISLDAAGDLYLEYNKKLNDLEAKRREYLFLIHQMQDPNFEISSLSTVLSDNVSAGMIQQTSQLLLDLKDQNNRSDKELNQLREELNLQRGFLMLHVQQISELNKLYTQLYEEKIYSLQNVKLELIHQDISVLEKNLHDYIETRMENLKQERSIIESHMKELHLEMATLPKRWAAEKLIEQNLETNQLIVQEVAKMVESKNISHKLELIQSAPIDLAIAPIHPHKNGAILYSILGAFLGGILSFGFVLTRALSNGIPASSANLKLMNQKVAGRLSQENNLSDSDLETMRRLLTFFEPNTLLLLKGTGRDYSQNLATLLKKTGKKVLTLMMTFDRSVTTEKPGLLQYLEGKAAAPTIQHKETGDIVEAGGTTPFAIELLSSAAFQTFFNRVKGEYDWVIAVSDALPATGKGESLLGLFPNVAVTVGEETLQELGPYTSAKADKTVAFVMTALDDQ